MAGPRSRPVSADKSLRSGMAGDRERWRGTGGWSSWRNPVMTGRLSLVANADFTGTCACCSLEALVASSGDLLTLYRAAHTAQDRESDASGVARWSRDI